MGKVFISGVAAHMVPPPDPDNLLFIKGDKIVDSSLHKVPLEILDVVVDPGSGVNGGDCMRFDGSSSIRFPSSAVNLGSKDFTIDWWEKCAQGMGGTEGTRFVTRVNDDSKYGGLLVGHSQSNIYMSTVANDWNVLNGASMMSVKVNEWVHWALVRSGNTFKSYRNGKLFATQTVSGSVYTDDYKGAIGEYGAVYQSSFNGWMQNFRVADIVRWTSDFDPPIPRYEK